MTGPFELPHKKAALLTYTNMSVLEFGDIFLHSAPHKVRNYRPYKTKSLSKDLCTVQRTYNGGCGYSLYFTATHIFYVGVLRWSRPPTPQFHIGDTNMLVSTNAKICVTPDAIPKICITPNTRPPECQSVEYRLPWVPNAKFSRWPCTFNFFSVDSIRVGSHFSVEYGLQIKRNEMCPCSTTTHVSISPYVQF